MLRKVAFSASRSWRLCRDSTTPPFQKAHFEKVVKGVLFARNRQSTLTFDDSDGPPPPDASDVLPSLLDKHRMRALSMRCSSYHLRFLFFDGGRSGLHSHWNNLFKGIGVTKMWNLIHSEALTTANRKARNLSGTAIERGARPQRFNVISLEARGLIMRST